MNELPAVQNPQSYSVVNLATDGGGPLFPRMQVNKSGGWVTFGARNLFPQEIIEICGRSPVNSAIIDSTVTYICGKGVRESTKALGGIVGVPNTAESWDEIVERVARDYKTFGGFYWQVVVNKGGTTVSVFHQDYSTVRIGQIDEKGRPLTFRISNDWTKTGGKYKPIELEAWPGMDTAKKGQAYLYHHWDYTPGLLFYSLPGFFPAIDYIKADGALGAFYNNSIDNGFTPSVILYMTSNPSEEKKEAFQKAFEGAFAGARGASKAIIVWGENGEVHSRLEPFSAATNADVYNNVEGIVFQKIISAHRLSSPTLAGVSGSGNLSGNAAEIINAYVLYNYTVIEKMRGVILDHLNRFTKINGTTPLVIDELDVLPKIRETEAGAAAIGTDNNGEAGAQEVESLASQLGVGGTQALTGIMGGDSPKTKNAGYSRYCSDSNKIKSI